MYQHIYFISLFSNKNYIITVHNFRDKRRKLDPSEYTYADLTSSQQIKRPGELNGQQFIIRNCTNTKIFLLDHTSSLTIDDCSDCIIVTGPVANRSGAKLQKRSFQNKLLLTVTTFSNVLSTFYLKPYSPFNSVILNQSIHNILVTVCLFFSIFLRDSKNCTLMCASSQLRLRDCQNIYLYVACESDPIIEASSDIIVGPYYLSYKGIKGNRYVTFFTCINY